MRNGFLLPLKYIFFASDIVNGKQVRSQIVHKNKRKPEAITATGASIVNRCDCGK
jgi:hypothetical protein